MVRIFALLALASSALAAVAPNHYCGNDKALPAAAEAEAQRVIAAYRADLQANNTRVAARAATIPVNWHIITDGSRGQTSQSLIQQQLDATNRHFSSIGYTFALNSIDVTNNADWYRNMQPDSSQERAAKSALRRGGASTLNVYTVEFNNGLLGYATFPSDYQSRPSYDGVVMDVRTLPGGAQTDYTTTTLTHEIGHWSGLLHVFQGGCSSSNDGVSDTSPQQSASRGCPQGKDTCSGGGPDNIYNFMDYSANYCMREFTPGQATRAQALMRQYRGV